MHKHAAQAHSGENPWSRERSAGAHFDVHCRATRLPISDDKSHGRWVFTHLAPHGQVGMLLVAAVTPIDGLHGLGPGQEECCGVACGTTMCGLAVSDGDLMCKVTIAQGWEMKGFAKWELQDTHRRETCGRLPQ